MDSEVVALLVVLVGKIVADASFSKKALTEVRLLREAVTTRLDNHEDRLDRLEK
jgi:hypothetical protein